MLNIGQFGWFKFRHFLRRNKWPIVLVFLAVSVTGIIALRGWKEIPSIINKTREEPKVSSSSLSEEIAVALREGDYLSAVNNLRVELKKDPDNAALNKQLSQLTEELGLDVKFHYLIGRKKYRETRTLSPDINLTSRDVYYFTVNPSHVIYLYFFQVDGTGKINVVYPNREYSPADNPVLPGSFRIPDGFQWFRLDETRGVETIYLVAARLENRRLEELIGKIKSEKNPKVATKLNQELISYLKSIEATPQSVPGVVVKVYQFTHG